MSNFPQLNRKTVADITQQVIVELIIDDKNLQPALDKLESSGQIDAAMAAGFKQTTAEMNKQAQAAKADTAAIAPLKKSLGDLALQAKKVGGDFEQGFAEGVTGALKDAGVSLEEFTNALATGQTEVSASTETLRSRLKTLTQQIAELKLRGEDNTEQFKAMVIEAGRIKDAMADAGQEIKNVASDTSTFDGLINAAQGLAGGFAIAQGTAALFGDESEELQKTLLKVNAAMAILQGLQQVGNVLQKESAAARLLDTLSLKVQTAAQGIYNTVVGESVGVLKAFRIALASTGIGLLILGIVELVHILNSEKEAVKNVNKALDENEKATLKARDAAIDRTEVEIAKLNALGATESRITSVKTRAALDQIAISEKSNQALEDQRKKLEEIKNTKPGLFSDEFFVGLVKGSKDVDEALTRVNDGIKKNNDEILKGRSELLQSSVALQQQVTKELLQTQIAVSEIALNGAKEGSKEQLNLQKQLIAQRAQLEIKTSQLTEAQKQQILSDSFKAQEELQVAFDKRRIDLQLKSVENQLVNVREGSEEEFKLKIQQLRLQTQAETTSTKLSEAEKKAIREKGLQNQLKLTREYNARVRKEDIQAQIDRNTVQLVNTQTINEDKLLLTISNIELTAQLEVDAAEGNSNKIKAIYAKRDADIAATNKAFIEQRTQDEIDNIASTQGANRRALQRLADDEKASVRARITAVQQVAEDELSDIQIREDSLEEERKKRLIGEEEYNLRYAKLQDDKAKVSEDAEKKITGIHKGENDKRRKQEQETIELVIQTVGQVIDIIQQLNDIRTQKDEERIAGERARVQELRETGAITEKEAILRNKRIDNEEKKLKREAAVRDKQVAIFNAIINTAQAVTKALATGGPILAIIAGALGAAEIAVIASRPIPKFRTGKKNQYEGPGKIGEAGAELFEHDGKMFLAKKETIVWLGKDDKVYTPSETKRMLPEVDKKVMTWKPAEKQTQPIDYDQLGKSVGKHVKIPGISVDENGFKVWEQEGQARKNYMDKRYSSK